MSYILQVDFPYTGPWGHEMAAAMDGLARSIANEPGEPPRESWRLVGLSQTSTLED